MVGFLSWEDVDIDLVEAIKEKGFTSHTGSGCDTNIAPRINSLKPEKERVSKREREMGQCSELDFCRSFLTGAYIYLYHSLPLLHS